MNIRNTAIHTDFYHFVYDHLGLYLMELVRYIHLNPLRAKLVSNLTELDQYPYGGHSTLMGSKKNPWTVKELGISRVS
jgi:hypothetical protein